MSTSNSGDKRKRESFYKFQTFRDPATPINPSATFEGNIRDFLENFTQLEVNKAEGMDTWSMLFFYVNRKMPLPLYFMEEEVKTSTQPFCDQCRICGWGEDFVPLRNYHLIIPAPDGQGNDFTLKNGCLGLQSHLLHGLIHCNGFGHLLCINGRKGGAPKSLSGAEIMDLWDRICTSLRVRKITVKDVSKKGSVDLHAVYAVAYGHSFFGRWGYRFYRGTFGVTRENYNHSIQILSSLNLEEIIQQCNEERMKQIIDKYRKLSPGRLTTLKDLLAYIFNLKSCPCAQKKASINATAVSRPLVLGPSEGFMPSQVTQQRAPLPGTDVDSDVDYIYNDLMLNPQSGVILVATQAIRRSLYFIKEWPARDETDQLLSFTCQVIGNGDDQEAIFNENAPYVELPLLPPHASVLQLKQVAQGALRSTYCSLERFKVERIKKMDHLDENMLLSEALGSGTEILVTGQGVDINLRHHGGPNYNRKVKCGCGAIYDDGESMEQCARCEMWQHVSCSPVADDSPIFFCPGGCESPKLIIVNHQD